MIRIAVLDDYQDVALEMADWSPLAGRAEVTVFRDHLSELHDIVERLLPFDVVCVMRERTLLPRSVIERLPRPKLIASTGPRNAAIDLEAAAARGIVVAHTGYNARPTIEMTWALILAGARQIALENAHLRAGGWQFTMGDSLLRQDALGVLGLGQHSLARRCCAEDRPRVRHGGDRLEPEPHERQVREHAERGWSPRKNSSGMLTS